MKEIATTLFLPLLLIAAIGWSVHTLGDRRILTRPPEAAVEGFVREVITKRYDRALPYLTEEQRRRLSSEDLRRYDEDLERRFGKILDVRGERVSIMPQRAEAVARVCTADGWKAEPFHLVFEEGNWAIVLDEARLRPIRQRNTS
jgi:hypothetical protein